MLSNFLVHQVLELFERETTFQGFGINLFLLAKRGGCVGLIYICRCGLHTIGVFCPAKLDILFIGRKYFYFITYSSPHFPHQCLWTANMEFYIKFNYFI